MLLFYENDVLNRMIVTYHPCFNEVPESLLYKIDIEMTERDVFEIIRSHPNEQVVFLYSGTVLFQSHEDTKIIAKSLERENDDDIPHENWYDYWATTISYLKDEELPKYAYEYYHKVPMVNTRRVVEALKNCSSLKVTIDSNSCSSLILQGRNLIERLQPIYTKHKNNSVRKTIDGVDCTLIVSDFLEPGYQLMDIGIKNVLVCEVNLKRDIVMITIISTENLLEQYVVSRRGIYKVARLALAVFQSLL